MRRQDRKKERERGQKGHNQAESPKGSSLCERANEEVDKPGDRLAKLASKAG